VLSFLQCLLQSYYFEIDLNLFACPSSCFSDVPLLRGIRINTLTDLIKALPGNSSVNSPTHTWSTIR
jgi:hypothetical protein